MKASPASNSPLPWKRHPFIGSRITDATGQHVASFSMQEDAEFILSLLEKEHVQDRSCHYCKRTGFELFKMEYGWPTGEGKDDIHERLACRDCRGLLQTYAQVLVDGPIEDVREAINIRHANLMVDMCFRRNNGKA